MDTSTLDIYVMMCEKAEEIQNSWKPDFGDTVNRVSLVQRIRLDGLDIIYPGGEGFITKRLCVWLPRQDQLQGMIDIPIFDLFWKFTPHIFTQFSDFPRCSMPFFIFLSHPEDIIELSRDGKTIEPKLRLYSLEQLWLCFVMFELYKKYWNGEEWVREE